MFLGRYKLVKKGDKQRHFEAKLLRKQRLARKAQEQFAAHPAEQSKKALAKGNLYYPIKKMHESVKQEIRDGLTTWYKKEPMMANFFEKPVSKKSNGVNRIVRRNKFGFLK